jgi:two-component system, OmpR family, osmolarity sensor histidine kinase EnvZ
MNFKWLKSILPKGLYGRAALILVLPVIVIQLAVSVVFIQRFFEDVTRQMTGSLALEVALFRDHVNQLETDAALDQSMRDVAGPLDLQTRLMAMVDVTTDDKKSFDDLTGRIVIDTLRAALPDLLSVDLSSVPGSVVLQLQTAKGPIEVQFARIRVSASNPHQLLVLMIVVSLFMTLISFFFLRNQLRPIRRLARASEAFGRGRHIEYHVSGATEVRQAGQAFIDMRNRIDRQIEQRTLMLSGVSHDLRTPLTRLKLGLSLAGPDEDSAALMRDVDDMEKMLEEFLAFSRGDSLEATEKIDPVALAQVLYEDAKRSGGNVVLNVSNAPAKAVQLPIRPVAMRRALDNLVTNALRYGSKCEILLEFEPADIIFTIEDNGPGIPETERAQAMRPFERLDAARNQNHGTGVGLGLAIAMDITSSHGGALVLSDSDRLGGLKVELRLPR